MNAKTARLTAARLALEAAQLRAAAELEGIGESTPLAEVAVMADRITTIQLAVEALERAIAIGERYQPTYFGDT